MVLILFSAIKFFLNLQLAIRQSKKRANSGFRRNCESMLDGIYSLNEYYSSGEYILCDLVRQGIDRAILELQKGIAHFQPWWAYGLFMYSCGMPADFVHPLNLQG